MYKSYTVIKNCKTVHVFFDFKNQPTTSSIKLYQASVRLSNHGTLLSIMFISYDHKGIQFALHKGHLYLLPRCYTNCSILHMNVSRHSRFIVTCTISPTSIRLEIWVFAAIGLRLGSNGVLKMPAPLYPRSSFMIILTIFTIPVVIMFMKRIIICVIVIHRCRSIV